ncbi:MAG: isoprenylcysteine carboxylmethyltransferase family protein [Patescibacteria group bacterium]|nr:isoprenylcysteine carboxylmethyltransferase family protein [Patescibacteria group bacterium]
MITYENTILLCWAAFIIFWVISAFNIKRDIRGGHGDWWWKFWPLRAIVAAGIIVFVVERVTTGTAHFTSSPETILFLRGIYAPSVLLGWIAAAVSVIGVSFAIWARVHLGRNWSPRPAVKANHELVTTGPYAYVRHPIYTGLIFMSFGAALTGSFFGVGVLVVASAIYVSRVGKEEKIMLELFPDEYPKYQKRTKRLVPFLW